MTDEKGLERDDEVASEQVGMGTPPGRPPAAGTGPRSPRLTDPPTGRRDDVRATEGADRPAVEGSRDSTEP